MRTSLWSVTGASPTLFPLSGHMVQAFWAWRLTRLARHQSLPSFVPSAPCPAQRECHSPSPRHSYCPLCPRKARFHSHASTCSAGSQAALVTREGSVLGQREGQAHGGRPGLSLLPGPWHLAVPMLRSVFQREPSVRVSRMCTTDQMTQQLGASLHLPSTPRFSSQGCPGLSPWPSCHPMPSQNNPVLPASG